MTRTPSPSKPWLAPAGLLLLVTIPLLAGGYRLSQLFGGAEVTPENARFFAMPIPVVAHILGAGLYTVLGAFQFVPGFRRRKPGWHRAAGWLLIPAGLVVALTSLWMTLFYPLPEADGDLLQGFRLGFGSAMLVSILLGVAAVRRRDIARHRVWMIRGYAIAVGAGTQALLIGPWMVIVGEPGEFSRAMLMAAGWVLNLGLAEWIIRRRPVGDSPRKGAPTLAGRPGVNTTRQSRRTETNPGKTPIVAPRGEREASGPVQ